MPTTTSARQTLAEAIRLFALAKDDLESAERIAAVAQAAVDGARAALAEFEGLDKAIATARLDALKSGNAARLEMLSARQRDRLLANEELASAEFTLELARGEADEARARVAELQPSVNNAATEVLSEEAGLIIAELEKVNERREYLRGLLRGLNPLTELWELIPPDTRKLVLRAESEKRGLPFGELPVCERLSRQIGAALSAQHPAGDRHQDKWREFADAVLRDPGAEVSILS